MAQRCFWLPRGEFTDDPHLSLGKSWSLSTSCLLPSRILLSHCVTQALCWAGREPGPSWGRGCKPSHPAALFPVQEKPRSIYCHHHLGSAWQEAAHLQVPASAWMLFKAPLLGQHLAACCIWGVHCMADISCCVIFCCPLHTYH